MDSLIGKTLLDRYEIKDKAGKGGMAEVYRASDLVRGHDVAIKVIRQDMADDPEFIKRFRREADALRSLQHRNIVRFYGFEQHGSTFFIVMDYIDGITLHQRLRDKRHPLSWNEIASIFDQMCLALHFGHRTNVLHRDIKPNNVMIGEGGRVFLLDFGLARAIDTVSVSVDRIGSPSYMSPEHCRGEEVDERSDLYSLGVVAYEMLAGRPPFRGRHAKVESSRRKKICWEHQNQPPVPPSKRNRKVPAELDKVILKTLAKDPEGRYPSISALREAFAEAVRGKLSQGAVRSRGSRPSEGRVWYYLTGGLLLCALIVVCLLGVLGPGPGTSTPTPAQSPTQGVVITIKTPTSLPTVTPTLQPHQPRRGPTSTRRPTFTRTPGEVTVTVGPVIQNPTEETNEPWVVIEKREGTTRAPEATPILSQTPTAIMSPTKGTRASAQPTSTTRPTSTRRPTSIQVSLRPTPTGTRTPTRTQRATRKPTKTPTEVTRLYPAPILLEPGAEHTVGGENRTRFRWDWKGTLASDECFEVVMSGSRDGTFLGVVNCTGSREIEVEMQVFKHIRTASRGHYYWTVRINRQLPSGKWITVSATPEPRKIKVA